jgi:hypothetical protein
LGCLQLLASVAARFGVSLLYGDEQCGVRIHASSTFFSALASYEGPRDAATLCRQGESGLNVPQRR